MWEEIERRHAPRLEDAVCDPRDITQCEADGQRDNPGVTATIYHAVCDGREISRSV